MTAPSVLPVHAGGILGSVMKPGTLVTWKNPTAEEAEDQFIVLQDRGDRVLVADASKLFKGWWILPRWVYSKSDLKEIPK